MWYYYRFESSNGCVWIFPAPNFLYAWAKARECGQLITAPDIRLVGYSLFPECCGALMFPVVNQYPPEWALREGVKA